MFRYKTLFLALSAVALTTGCSSGPTTKTPAFDIKPVQTVTHGNGNAQTLYQMGRYYQGQLRYEQALDFYRQALAIEPQNVDALTGMGVAQAMQGQYIPALEAFKAAVALEPDSPYLLNNLGYVHWLLKDRDRALDAYRQALRLDPLNARFRTNLRAVMVDAANKPQVAQASKPDPALEPAVTRPVELVLARSVLALNQVAPQVYELRKSQMPEAVVQNARPPVSSVQAIASVEAGPAEKVVAATAGGTTQSPLSSAALALNEVAPRVYELRMPALWTEADAQQGVTQVAVQTPPPTVDSKPVQNARVTPMVVPVAEKAEAAALEVVNGNGVKGIAGKVSLYLAAKGFPVEGVGDHTNHNEARTRIEYESGHVEQARRLGALMPGKVLLSKVDSLGGQANIRLVLGHDVRQERGAWNAVGKTNPATGVSMAMPGEAKSMALEVANGNGVRGMARKMALYLAERGYDTAVTYDLRPFNKSMTRIEYRKGYASQAIQLGDQLPRKVAYVEANGLRSNVRLVLGHDIKENMAAWSPPDKVKLAKLAVAAHL
ncbi:MAG: LytR C-terminal domain-containing protein [Thiobacillus sp.]